MTNANHSRTVQTFERLERIDKRNRAIERYLKGEIQMTELTATVELTDEQIAELLSGSKQRGVHPAVIKRFLSEDNEAKAWNVMALPEYKDKKVMSVGIGLRNAVKSLEAEKQVRVIANAKGCFLVKL